LGTERKAASGPKASLSGVTTKRRKNARMKRNEEITKLSQQIENSKIITDEMDSFLMDLFLLHFTFEINYCGIVYKRVTGMKFC